MKASTLAVAVSAALPLAAHAVYLDPDGLGQALVYPYYTAQSANGNPFNTYLSVVNHTAEAKALRVRLREGRNGAEVGSFNLFLAPNDVWAGAVVPTGSGATLIMRDRSCVDGPFAIDFAPGSFPYLEFRNTLYTGSNSDGAGDGLDRTREGYVEIIEMATLTGNTATFVGHNAAGFPMNCGVIAAIPAADITPPTGGLSGTLTLINVANGMDFTVNADALAGLTAQPFYRAASDAYPAFDAAEVTPVSVVAHEGSVYRSTWARGIDAVSAVFMRSVWQGEYVLDVGTRSKTDFVATLPTRHYYVRADDADAPFSRARGGKPSCALTGRTRPGEDMGIIFVSREAQTGVIGGSSLDMFDYPTTNFCNSTTVFSPGNFSSPHLDTGPTSRVTGSINAVVFDVPSVLHNGWLAGHLNNFFGLNSLSSSSRMQRDGAVMSGAHTFNGLPMTGFALRTFENGTLTCAGASCQGNYGGSFPLKFRRAITPN